MESNGPGMPILSCEMMGRASQGEQWQCCTESSMGAMPTKAVPVLSSPAVTLVAVEVEAEILGSLLRHTNSN